MTQQIIGIGSAPNDGTGDTLRDAFDKANDNFTELYQSGPTIDLDKYGVSPGNSAATNQAAIANVIASLKAASIPGFHLRLNRAGTFNLTRGSDGAGLALYATRKAAILLPSNCTLELGPDTKLQLSTPDESTYLVRNDDPVNGNVNIAIKGGIWDGNSPTGSGSNDEIVVGGQGFFGTLMWFENINRFMLSDVVCQNPGRWAIAASKLNNFLFDRCYMDNVPRDGIHLVGDCHNGTVRDFRGETHDNSIAISTAQNASQGQVGGYFGGQFNYADGTLLAGSHSNILIDSPRFDNCNGPIALFGRPTESITGVTIRNVRGTTDSASAYGISAALYPLISSVGCPIYDLTIDDVAMTTKAEEPCIILTGDVRSVKMDNISVAGGKGVILTGENYETVQIGRIANSKRSDNSLLQLGIASSSQPFHAKHLQIGQCAAVMNSVAEETINIQSNASWDDFSIDDLVINGGALTQGVVCYGTTRRRINIKRSRFVGNIDSAFSGPLDIYCDHIDRPHCAHLAVNSRLVSRQIDPITGNCRVYLDSFVTAGPCKLQLSVSFTDVNGTAGTVAAVTGATLPRGALITGFAIKSYQAFTGGAISNVTIQPRRLTGGTALLGSAVSVFTADTAAAVPQSITPIGAAMNSPLAFDLLVISTSANLDQLTQGKAYAEIEYRVFATAA